nr:primary amine oxidase [Quercus suber]
MICVFEKYAGDIGWRHSESPITGMEIREGRPKVTLVVRMAASVANYDYIVDWEFQTDGLIRIKGLPKEFNAFKSAIRTRSTQLSFDELSTLVNAEEESLNDGLEVKDSIFAMAASANQKSNGNGYNHN